MVYKFKLKGLDCANCAAELEEALKKIAGIENVSISFISERMEIECKEMNEEMLKEIKKVIKREEPDATLETI